MYFHVQCIILCVFVPVICVIGACSFSDMQEPVAVTQVVCTRNRGTPLVVASLEG